MYMKNKYMYIIYVIIFILAIGIGYLIYNANSHKTNELVNTTNNLITEELNYTVKNDISITTVSEEEKTTPNTLLILKKEYENCGHTIKEYVEIPADLVNLTKEQIQKEYNNWIVEEFSEDEVILSKEIEGSCNQHYVLREKDGKIAIYNITDLGKEELKEITNISIEYLTEDDLLRLNGGIMAYGQEELNSIIEDFE